MRTGIVVRILKGLIVGTVFVVALTACASTAGRDIPGDSPGSRVEATAEQVFEFPRSVVLDPLGRIYVSDMGRHRIVRLDDITGKNLYMLENGQETGQQFNTPCGMAFTQDDALIVIDKQNSRLLKFPSLRWEGVEAFDLAKSSTFMPLGIAADESGAIYLSDSGNSRIVRIDRFGGEEIAFFGSRGEGTGKFLVPRAVGIGPDGKIHILDSDNRRIVRIDDISGRGWAEFGSRGEGEGQFEDPIAIAFDAESRILILDAWNHRVVRFDNLDGDHWISFGTEGSGQGQFLQPMGLAVDSRGRIYISDTGNKRIVRIDDMIGNGWIEFQ